MKYITTWRGEPIENLSKAELIMALAEAAALLEDQRERHSLAMAILSRRAKP